MCEGKLVSGAGTELFQEVPYALVQANDDYEQDGLKNGEEVEVIKSGLGKVYVRVKSSPVNDDTDGDGIIDYNDTKPLEWYVCDRDLAIFAALAYEDGTDYVNSMYENH